MAKTLGQRLEVGIEIGGKVGRSLDQAVRQARSKIGGLNTQLRDLGSQAERSFGRVADSRLWQAGAVGAAAFFGVIANGTRQASALNQELSGLQKHLDGLDASGMARIQRDVLNLSARTGLNARDTAGLFVAGAESGRRQQELGAFAQLASRTSIATGMTPAEAGQAINQLQAAAGLDLSRTQRFMDQINGLSDRLSTTAPKVTDFAMRTAGLTQQMNLGTGSLTAFGGVMLDSGVAPEIAATSFHAMTRALVAGEAATNAQKEAYASLGLTAEEVAKGMQRDAEGTLNDVIRRLREAAPDRRQSIAYRLFGAEASKGLTPLVNNYNKLLSMQAAVRKGQTVGSIEKEHARWLGSTSGQTALMQANLSKLSVTLGNVLVPAMNRILAVGVPVVERMAAWAEKNPQLTAGLVALGGVLAGLVIAAPALSAAFTVLAGAGKLLLGLKLAAVIAGWAGAIGPLGATIAALATGPVGLVALAVVGVGAAVAWLYGRFEWFKAGVDGYLSGLVRGWQGAWTFIVGLATGNMAKVRQGWGQMVSGMKQAFGSLMNLIRRGFAETFRWLLGEAMKIPGKLASVWRSFQGLFPGGGDSPANNIRPIPRANGGRVRPRQAYLIGERRPEVVEFGAAGVVHPRVEIAAAGARSSGSGGAAPVFNVTLAVNAQGVDAEAVERALRDGWRKIEWEIASSYRSLLND